MTAPTSDSVETRNSTLVLLAVVGGLGLAVGALTSFGQTYLPFPLSPLANSAGSWVLLAYTICLVNRQAGRGAVLGFEALAAMLGGYVITSALRGFPWAWSTVIFWLVAAAVVGPVIGVGSAWARERDPRRTTVAYAPLAGVLVGEGIYGLTVLSESTPTGYWVVQIVFGGLIAMFGAAMLRPNRRAALGLIAVAVVVALLYSVVVRYGSGLFTLFQ